jgi:anti-sigma regulatory factor (Ser/Thr protein kinase)
MATTRTLLRAAAERLAAPGAVLERTNNVLVQEIPPKMFVTCFYAVLDPATGHLCYANAGHDVPYRYTADGIVELRATGMPLGLMPGMDYEEKETTLAPGEYVLLYSDGLVEAHNSTREMFGFPHLQQLLATHADGDTLKEFLLDQLAAFTGPGWEQEDDVTLVTLQRKGSSPQSPLSSQLVEIEIPSAPGNERLAMQQVADVSQRAGLPDKRLERLKTAVAEATMNAMEHGNRYDPDKPVRLKLFVEGAAVRVTITDDGGGKPLQTAAAPDLEAKLAGEQSPRGWGLFLIQNMVDEMHVHQDDQHHTIELVMYLADQQGE